MQYTCSARTNMAEQKQAHSCEHANQDDAAIMASAAAIWKHSTFHGAILAQLPETMDAYGPDQQQRRCIPLSPKWWKILRHTQSVYARLAVLVLVAAEAVIFILWQENTDTGDNDSDDGIDSIAVMVVSLTILGLLLFDVFARLVFEDCQVFFRSFWNWFDLIVIIASIVGELFLQIGSAIVLGLLVRLIHSIWVVWRNRVYLPKKLRQKVSENRRRFQKDGFDLDITYITERVIAMSVPAVGVEAVYRNPATEVARFFDSRHPNRYMLFNLCPERKYPFSLFHDRVQTSYMADHNPAPLQQIVDFCRAAEAFLAQHDKNVVAVHCKGGKGRTGTMVCSYLLWCGIMPTALEALQFFANRRTSETGAREGVEARSQERYVEYIERVVVRHERSVPPPVPVTLAHLRVYWGQQLTRPQPVSSLRCVVQQGAGRILYDQRTAAPRDIQNEATEDGHLMLVRFPQELQVAGDIRVSLFGPTGVPQQATQVPLVYFWFNTTMETLAPPQDSPPRASTFNGEFQMVLPRDKVDGVRKRPEIFPPNFRIELHGSPEAAVTVHVQ